MLGIKLNVRFISFSIILAVILCGCAGKVSYVVLPSAVPQKTITKTAIPLDVKESNTLPDINSDPWQHCATVTVSNSSPEKVSEIENEEFRRRVQITFMIQNEALENTFIADRCMNGKLYVCLINGLNNCAEKLDFTTEPNEAMQAYCADEEMEGAILHPTIISVNSAFEWRCHDGAAVITNQIAEPDAYGYDKSIWYEIPAPY